MQKEITNGRVVTTKGKDTSNNQGMTLSSALGPELPCRRDGPLDLPQVTIQRNSRPLLLMCHAVLHRFHLLQRKVRINRFDIIDDSLVEDGDLQLQEGQRGCEKLNQLVINLANVMHKTKKKKNAEN